MWNQVKNKKNLISVITNKYPNLKHLVKCMSEDGKTITFQQFARFSERLLQLFLKREYQNMLDILKNSQSDNEKLQNFTRLEKLVIDKLERYLKIYPQLFNNNMQLQELSKYCKRDDQLLTDALTEGISKLEQLKDEYFLMKLRVIHKSVHQTYQC